MDPLFNHSETAESAGKTRLAERFRGFLPVVIDIETAGFNSQTDAVLQIGAVLLDMEDTGYLRPERSLFYEVEPFAGANLEQAALDFNGIEPYAETRGAVTEEAALQDLFRQIRRSVKSHGCTRAVLVGHNAHFDHGFLMKASERCAIKRNPFHPFSTLDTVSLSALAYGQTVLAKACEAAAIDFDSRAAHAADYDAERTADLFCEIVNRWFEMGGWQF